MHSKKREIIDGLNVLVEHKDSICFIAMIDRRVDLDKLGHSSILRCNLFISEEESDTVQDFISNFVGNCEMTGCIEITRSIDLNDFQNIIWVH